MLKLHPHNRSVGGSPFLQACLSEYESLFTSSQVNGLDDMDELVEINEIKKNPLNNPNGLQDTL
jgi:hypothetical protein